jgi:Na+/H+-dicarboxylate symporter
MDCLQENSGISNKVTSFVLPLGATVNMDGTALYEAVTAIFVAQAYGIDLSIGQQLIIMLTATLASIGAAAIPGAGLVTLVIVLKAVNLPLEGIGMILAVERILDMFRTAVNVWGDACGAAVVARLEGEKLNYKPMSK